MLPHFHFLPYIYSLMQKYAIIVAGGTGTRMGGDIPKQFMLLKGKPVLWHTLHAFIEAYEDMQVVLVLPEAHFETGQTIAKEFPFNRIKTTTGGTTRFHSVKNGLNLVDTHAILFVHDAVRCLVTPQLIRHCCEVALEKGNAVPATAATDTIRILDETGNYMPDRKLVRIIQTPQTFFSNVIKEAYAQPYREDFTDEASVVEKMGVKINLVEGEVNNIKITKPVDLIIAEKILEERGMKSEV
jgi:2-C-methyl-D-erythritol 4-phosphate cytidylyltransferase